MENKSPLHSIQAPKQTLVLRPKSYRQKLVAWFMVVLAIPTVIAGVVVSPYILLLLLVLLPGIILPLMYVKNGSIRLNPEGIELSGYTGKIQKRISYTDVYQVALVNELFISSSNGAIGFAVVFLDKNGDQLFFAWSINYTKEDLVTLYNLFEDRDKVSYEKSLNLRELKQLFLDGKFSV